MYFHIMIVYVILMEVCICYINNKIRLKNIYIRFGIKIKKPEMFETLNMK